LAYITTEPKEYFARSTFLYSAVIYILYIHIRVHTYIHTYIHVCIRVKEKRNILHTIKRSTASWIGHILIEGKLEGRTEMKVRRGRRRKQLLDELKEKRKYWKLKEEALDRTL
jgi:hypothetical protein